MKKYIASCVAVILGCTFTVAADAGLFDKLTKPEGKDAQLVRKVQECNDIIKEFTSSSDVKIPKNLLKDAKAVLIFSDAVRAGLIVTGQFAQGIALAKNDAGQWSAPAFFRMSGVGIGLQIGGDVTDAVFVFRDENSMRNLLEHHFTMGADASAAAGKKGRQLRAEVGKDTKISSYGRSKGLFAGMSFDGVVIKQDAGANRKYYGKEMDARDILLNGKGTVTKEASELIDTLKKHA